MFFYTTYIIHRACMDGSNRIIMDNIVSLNGLAVDFVKDRLYWTVDIPSRIYHSNLDLTDVMYISSDTIQSSRSLVMYKGIPVENLLNYGRVKSQNFK